MLGGAPVSIEPEINPGREPCAPMTVSVGGSASAEYVPRLLDVERGHHRLVDRGSRQISLLLTVRECVVATECKSAYMSSLGCRRRRTRPGCRTVGGRNSDHTTTPNRPCPIRLSPLTSRFSAT